MTRHRRDCCDAQAPFGARAAFLTRDVRTAVSSPVALRPIRHQPGAAQILEVGAEALLQRGDAAGAVRLMAMADGLHERSHSPPLGVEAERNSRLVERMRAACYAEEFETAWVESHDADFDAALEAGLEAARHSAAQPPP